MIRINVLGDVSGLGRRVRACHAETAADGRLILWLRRAATSSGRAQEHAAVICVELAPGAFKLNTDIEPLAVDECPSAGVTQDAEKLARSSSNSTHQPVVQPGCVYVSRGGFAQVNVDGGRPLVGRVCAMSGVSKDAVTLWIRVRRERAVRGGVVHVTPTRLLRLKTRRTPKNRAYFTILAVHVCPSRGRTREVEDLMASALRR